VDRECRKGLKIGDSGQQRVASSVTSPLTWPASRVREAIAPPLNPDEVHLWAWVLEPATVDVTAHVEILSRQESERMRAFHFAPDRLRYAVAHANMRRILGGYLQRRPEKVCFAANRFGKPELANEEKSSLQFNLSHTQSIAVLAVAQGQPVGVDVEEVRPIEPEAATAHFSAAELSNLGTLHGDAWLAGFYRCWTRKEAILKAEGVGLHRALDSFDVGLLLDEPAELVATRECFSHPWKLHHLSPAPGTIGALATAQSELRLACFTFLYPEPG
jgi:4'-phosphopantetheinyl transferase